MANLKPLVHKLQTALLQQGVCITMTQVQSWSEKYHNMTNIFLLKEKAIVKGKKKDIVVLSTNRLSEAVAYLAGRLNGGG